MSKENLMQSAAKLKQPDKTAAEEYSRKMNTVVDKINSILSKRADLNELIGINNIDMMYNNHKNHAMFIESVLHEYQPVILVNTVIWVFRAYRSHGFHLTYWPAQLNTWIEILKQELTDSSFQQIYPFYKWMLINQAEFVELSEEN